MPRSVRRAEYQRLFIFLGAGIVTLLSIFPFRLEGQDLKKAVRLARQFLESDDEDDREELAESLSDYDDQIEQVVSKLRRTTKRKEYPSGLLADESFSSPELRKKREEDLLHFIIPPNYRPGTASGLIVFLHGGGRESGRSWPKYYFEQGLEDESYVGDILEESGMIVVGASAPADKAWARWCLEEATEYVSDVILECKHRFHIDDDRVFLMGHSMGGFGAYHHGLIQPDRFAGIMACSGSWMKAYWPAIRGTSLYIIHGKNDAKLGERGHFTDIRYARETRDIFKSEKLVLNYFEHKGGHDLADARKVLRSALEKAADEKRDPFYRHIGLASRNGFHPSTYYSHRVRHNRWLTLNEPTSGEIAYSRLESNSTRSGDDTTSENPAFDRWDLDRYSEDSDGCSLDAKIESRNVIRVETQCVQKFTIWLHPKMVDFRKPVTVVVDGKEVFADVVEPSLRTALESYERRQDWGLVYHARIVIDVE